MIIANETITTLASIPKIWSIYEDLGSWPLWDKDVEYAYIVDSSFKQGTKGVLKPKGGPKVNLVFSEVIPNNSFTTISSLPLTKLIFSHRLEKTKTGKTRITHHIDMKGLLSPLFALLIGLKIKAGLLDAMKNLASLAES